MVPHRWLILFLLLTPFASAQTQIKISHEELCNGATIDPRQYGQFVEYLCDLVPGMWAEKLDDTDFDGLSPYKFEYIKETDNKQHSWHPTGATNRAKYSIEDGWQKIEITGDTPATAGIAQDGISCRKDELLVFNVAIRTAGGASAVAVHIRNDSERIFGATTSSVDGNVQAITGKAMADADNATLTIEFRGPGTLWIDHTSLTSAPNVERWRKDVVDAVRDLHPSVIRFGGSAVEGGELGDLEWKDLVGPIEKRKPFRAWGGLQPRGAGLNEFLTFCKAVDAEPLMCVRFNNRTPKDAADEVEYFNGSEKTPMGHLRALHGFPKPRKIKLWQIGNEIGGDDYANRVGEFAAAMKQVDPSIQILSSFPNPKFIAKSGDLIDYVCPHHYTRDLKGMEQDLLNTQKMIRDNSPARQGDKIKVAVTEWNTTAGDVGLGRATLWSLDNALSCARYQNLLHRHADLVKIANRSNLANSFCSGIIQTNRRGRLFKTPTYYAQQLYATLAGTHPLKVTSDSPDLDISATASDDRLTLFVVNPTSKGIDASIDLSDIAGVGIALDVYMLADSRSPAEPDGANSFEEPQRLHVTKSAGRIDNAVAKQAFPGFSLTVLQTAIAHPQQ